MKVYILIYDGFANFEVALAALFMKSKGEVITVGTKFDPIISEEGFRFIPHTVLNQIQVNEVDLFIIPGGDPNVLLYDNNLPQILAQLNSLNKMIAGICSAPIHMAKSGILEGKNYTTSLPYENYVEFSKSNYIDQNVVVDGNIITARGKGYVDFAITLGKIMNIYEDEIDMKETINYFKYFK